MRTNIQKGNKVLTAIVCLSITLFINAFFMFCTIVYAADLKTENKKLKEKLRFDRSVKALLSDLSKK